MKHIRTVEWQNVFNNNDNETTLKQQINLPTKLKIQKYNRPLNVQLDDKIKTYCNIAKSKLINLEEQVNKQSF